MSLAPVMRRDCGGEGVVLGGRLVVQGDGAERRWLVEVEHGEDALLGGGGLGAAGDGGSCAGERAQMHLVELVAQGAPRVPGADFGEADE